MDNMKIWNLQNMNNYYIIRGTGKYFICPKNGHCPMKNTHMTILHNVTKLQNHKDTDAYNILYTSFLASAAK